MDTYNQQKGYQNYALDTMMQTDQSFYHDQVQLQSVYQGQEQGAAAEPLETHSQVPPHQAPYQVRQQSHIEQQQQYPQQNAQASYPQQFNNNSYQSSAQELLIPEQRQDSNINYQPAAEIAATSTITAGSEEQHKEKTRNQLNMPPGF